MTEQEFAEKFSHSPWDTEECAGYATHVEGSIADVAKAYLAALRRFEEKLEEIGFEFG
jgi:hypothetical protein